MQKGDNVLSEMKRLERTVKDIKKDMEDTATQSYFSVVNPNKWLWNASERRQNGTGLWFIQGQKFQAWKSGEERMLWVHGIPGAGKTTLAALAIATAKVGAFENTSSQKTTENGENVQIEAVAYFFCDYRLYLHWMLIRLSPRYSYNSESSALRRSLHCSRFRLKLRVSMDLSRPCH
ncbi:hypothetical protein DL95DRAFT_382626 [Leptodontidium sp. 2 PMI_412]|nr:hypothetical protein DL95DRAFT_382626 [Leptodontidium sp. 2 PMI_412]